ncbi:hypothetical protein TNCV_198161 [Trichonephila clavipes]|nr:hypothetical protein TNCV_198161 [Trichonephila clavipes]
MPCLLRSDWSRPINAESGRGKGLGRSEKKPDPKQDLEIKLNFKIPTSWCSSQIERQTLNYLFTKLAGGAYRIFSLQDSHRNPNIYIRIAGGAKNELSRQEVNTE